MDIELMYQMLTEEYEQERLTGFGKHRNRAFSRLLTMSTARRYARIAAMNRLRVKYGYSPIDLPDIS
jgi:hypothetical protein